MATSDTATGPGSAARNTSRTSRRESIEIEIGTFPAGQLYYCHAFFIATWRVHIFLAPKANLIVRDFSRPATKRYCHLLY